MRHRQNRRDDAVGSELLERDAVVAAARVGAEPLDARHELHDLELRHLVGQAADLGLSELELAPFVRLLRAERFDDLDDFGAPGDAGGGELEKRLMRGGAGGRGVRKHARAAAAAHNGGSRFRGGERRSRGRAAESLDDFLDDAPDEHFINGE